MFRNQHITSCSLLVVEVHLFLPIFTNYSVTTKGPWFDQYSCPFSWLVELVNKANCYILWTGQMNQILYLSCDWLPERARWSPILPSRDCSQYPAKNFLESFIDQARWCWGGWILGTRKRTSPSPVGLTSRPDPADEGCHGNRCVTSARHGIYAWSMTIYLFVCYNYNVATSLQHLKWLIPSQQVAV